MLWRIKIFFLAVFHAVFTLFAEICILLRMYSVPRALYRLGLKIWPDRSGRILPRLGFLYEREGNLEKAVECYEQARKLEPSTGTRFWDLGCVYERQGKLSLAIENYEKALQLGTDFGTDFRNELQSRIKKLKGVSEKKGTV